MIAFPAIRPVDDPSAMCRAYAATVEPPEDLSPSQWSAKHRELKEGTTERPGPWDNSVFPHGVDLMDVVAEAIETGKTGVVCMKSAQGAGTEVYINVIGWLLDNYPGPILYLTSKEEVAREFSRDRFSYMIEHAAPLARKAITGRAGGELLQVKRFVDGKLVLQGGRSVLNLQSQPYRSVIIDEYDSMLDEIAGHGDPLKLAQARTDAFTGATLIIAFAHPSIRDRGAGKLYYEDSDQRRGHITCPHCQHLADDAPSPPDVRAGAASGDLQAESPPGFWLDRPNLLRSTPREGQTAEAAMRDPSTYALYAPCCGAEVSDAQRWAAIRAGVRQRSVLDPEVAAAKSWIGVHFNQLYYMHKTVRDIAAEYVDCLGDDAQMRVFVNKKDGDVYESAVQETTEDDWRSLTVVPRAEDDPADYALGTVPPGVQFLTAGQDSNTRELHWAVWGWGLVRDTGDMLHTCGWLVDCGVIQREPPAATLEESDLMGFDQLLYARSFPSADGKLSYQLLQCYHDIGWQPLGPQKYAQRWPGRAVPTKGDAVDSASRTPVHRWGSPIRWMLPGGGEYVNKAIRIALLNTHLLKQQFFGMVAQTIEVPGPGDVAPGRIKHPRITLPRGVRDDFIRQSASERLVNVKRKQVWKARGANHWSDCNIYAFACAQQNDLFQPGLPLDEVKAQEERQERERRGRAPGGITMPDGRAFLANQRRP